MRSGTVAAIILLAGCAHNSPAQGVKHGADPVSPDEAAHEEASSAGLVDHTLEYWERLAKELADDDPGKPGVLEKLADEYVQVADTYSAKAAQMESALWQAEQDGDEEAREKLANDLAKIRELISIMQHKAMQNYELILDQYPDYEKADDVMFGLAFMYDEQAMKATAADGDYARKAGELYLKLMNDFPLSKHVPAAQVSLGDATFSGGDMTGALEMYIEATQYPDSPVFAYAVYKQAWCHINLQQYPEALDAFIRVIEYASDHPENENAHQLQIQARKDLCLPFSKFDKPQAAWKLFEKYCGELAISCMERLAEMYEADGLQEQASVIYDTLMKVAPDHGHLGAWKSAVTELSGQ